MTCLEARRELLADPMHPSADLLAHLAGCTACTQAWERARELDQRLQRALKVPPPDGLAERILLAQTTRRRQHWRWRKVGYALAASLVLALTVGVAWQFGARPIPEAQALEHYVVDHIRQEPQALTATQSVPLNRVRALLHQYGLTLAQGVDNIVYANQCLTPSGTGVHLVVRTYEGPVTFIYLPENPLDERVALDEAGFEGYAAAFQQGAVALVGTPGEAFEQVSAQLLAAIVPSQD